MEYQFSRLAKPTQAKLVPSVVEEEKRYNGLFECFCGARLNSDYNGAKNILKRALGFMSKVGATVNLPKTNPTDRLNPMMRLEAPSVRVG